MTNWVATDARLGLQAITGISTTQNHPLGTVIRAYDADGTFGEGEFIYLKGVANTIAGSAVSYDASFQTALAAVGSNLPRAIAFAMSANVANDYGWYQIGGLAVAAKAAATSLAANAAVGVKTTGLIAASGSGAELGGALVAAVASAKSGVTTVKLMIDRPKMQGRIT